MVPRETITAGLYSGCYGGEIANNGTAIVVEVTCPNRGISMDNKQIIFVVDKSNSMESTMRFVKSSLFAARDSLLLLCGKKSPNENERDRTFSQDYCCSVVTFGDSASCVWESRSPDRDNPTFSQAVREIRPRASTNLGSGILLAFEKKIPEMVTWIIVFTDGIPNKGDYQTKGGFKRLMEKVPPRTKIISLGYTKLFDPDILSVLGPMTYLDSEESIAGTFGNIIGEIATCYGINAVVEIPTLPTIYLSDDDIITPASAINSPRDIVGRKEVGYLYNAREYIYVTLPWGNTIIKSHEGCDGIMGTISYMDIYLGETAIVEFRVRNREGPYPPHVRESYFSCSKARLILTIHHMRKKGDLDSRYISFIRDKLLDWEHPESLPHKREVFRVLNNLITGEDDRINIVDSSSSIFHQSSYRNFGKYLTETQRLASQGAMELYKNYNRAQEYL